MPATEPKNLNGAWKPKSSKTLNEAIPYMEGNETEPKAKISRMNDKIKKSMEYWINK